MSKNQKYRKIFRAAALGRHPDRRFALHPAERNDCNGRARARQESCVTRLGRIHIIVHGGSGGGGGPRPAELFIFFTLRSLENKISSRVPLATEAWKIARDVCTCALRAKTRVREWCLLARWMSVTGESWYRDFFADYRGFTFFDKTAVILVFLL